MLNSEINLFMLHPMIRYFIKTFNGCRPWIILLCLVLAAQGSYAQKKTKKKGLGIDAEVSLSTMYDDNILKYSEKYLTRFLNREDEGRFHIKTYDDVVLSPSVTLTRSFRFFGKKLIIFDAGYTLNAYVKNDINNWSNLSIGVRQNFAKRASLKLSYSYIPSFYIRHFRDDDWVAVFGYTPQTFKPYIFSKDTYAFWIQNTFLKNSRIMFTFNYQVYFHNESYTEYDCRNYLYRIKLFQPVHKKLRMELMYQFTKSFAKGYDQPHETKENSDDGDASFDEDGFSAGLIWTLPKFKKYTHSLKGECVVYERYYTTKQFLELDLLHSGRMDDNVRLNFNYDLTLSKKWTVSAFYSWYYRDSGSKSAVNSGYISDEKDYTQNQIGLALKYGFRF